MEYNPLKANHCFGGVQGFYSHESELCGKMEFAVFQPPQIADGPRPVVYFLSGLTCTAENFVTKAGAQRLAAELGLIVVCPDTSPRGAGFDGEDDSWDFGTGAGFYVDATTEPWSQRYQMYSYVTEELPALIDRNFPTRGPDARSIFGHSMGGHGALVAGLREPSAWQSVSALSPVVAPTEVPWGTKAFSKYLGPDSDSWKIYDACQLVAASKHPRTILIDQGEDDDFLQLQLRPERFAQACQASGQSLELNMRPGYDHSYYFIASFVDNHLRHHARFLL